MAQRTYIPERGDFIWVNLNPRQGHEQAGHRPALVLSPKSYHRKTGLCVLCPATRHAKGYAFEVLLTQADGSQSVILADHVRNIDWRAREVRTIFSVPSEIVEEVVAKLEALIIGPF